MMDHENMLSLSVDAIQALPVNERALAILQDLVGTNQWNEHNYLLLYGDQPSGRRLSRREVAEMSDEWVDKKDNPGMAELGLESADAFGGVVVFNFADATRRVALTSDFVKLVPVTKKGQPADLASLTPT
jgi:hypothetical protein